MKVYHQEVPSDLWDLYQGSLQPACPILSEVTETYTGLTILPTDFTFVNYVKMRDPFRIPHLQGPQTTIFDQ